MASLDIVICGFVVKEKCQRGRLNDRSEIYHNRERKNLHGIKEKSHVNTSDRVGYHGKCHDVM